MEEIIREINIKKIDVVVLTEAKKKKKRKEKGEEGVKDWEIIYTFSAG